MSGNLKLKSDAGKVVAQYVDCGDCGGTFIFPKGTTINFCVLCGSRPTPAEGEAVPEQSEEFEMHITPRSVTRIPIPAPVVSTAAPVAKKPKREPTQCANCKNKIIPFGDYLWTHAATCNMMCNLAAKPLAPESYKPAEGQRDQSKRAWPCPKCALKNNPTCDHEYHTDPEPAATPVTVEAPELCQCGDGGCIECWPANFTKEALMEELNAMRKKMRAATPKPIGDVEAVNEAIKDAIEELFRHICMRMPKNSVFPIKFSEAETIMRSHLSPFFAPAGPDSATYTVQAEDECATLRKERDEAERFYKTHLKHWQDRAEAALAPTPEVAKE